MPNLMPLIPLPVRNPGGEGFLSPEGAWLPSVTAAIKVKYPMPPATLPGFQGALVRGRRVHALTAAADMEGAPSAHLARGEDAIRPYCEAWDAYRALHSIRMEVVEGLVYDPELGFAGYLDRLARYGDGSWGVIDLKTGATGSRPSTWVKLQLVAYVHAARATFKLPVIHRAAVLLMPSGQPRLFDYPVDDLAEDRERFAECLRHKKQSVQQSLH